MPSRSRFDLKIEGLPLRLFGYRREDVRRWVDELMSEEAAASAAHQDLRARQEAALAKMQARRRALEEILAHLETDTQRLREQVKRTRENAAALEEGARHEAARLRAAYEARLDEIRQSMPEVEAELRRTEADLESMLAAVGAAIVSEQQHATDRPAPTTGSAQALADMAVAIFGADVDPDGLTVRSVAPGLFRTEVPWKAARVQTRSGDQVGDLTALILHGRHLALIGYEVAADGSPQGAVPASDVVAVRRQTVIVADTFRLLDAARLPREEAYTLVAIGAGNVRPRSDDDSPADGVSGSGPAVPEHDLPATSSRSPGGGAPEADAGWHPGDDLLPAPAWQETEEGTPLTALGPDVDDAPDGPAAGEPSEGTPPAAEALLPASPARARDLGSLDQSPAADAGPAPADVASGVAGPSFAEAPGTKADADRNGGSVPGSAAAPMPDGPGQAEDLGLPAGVPAPAWVMDGSDPFAAQSAPETLASEGNGWLEDDGQLPPPVWAADDGGEPAAARAEPTPASGVEPPRPARTPRPTTSPALPAAHLTGPSPGLGDDVLMFLEGKVVGTDIYDGSGNLLAAAGTPIDRDLVAKAEAAGKLPDLIVYMTLPG